MAQKKDTKVTISYDELIKKHEERLAIIQEDLAKVPALQAEANQLVGAIRTLKEVVKREATSNAK